MKMKMLDRRQVNRPGTSLAPELTEPPLPGTQAFEPSPPRKREGLSETRAAYAGSAEPTPSPVKDLLRTAAVAGPKGLVFADKLGERLAFERWSVRLYDALLSKLDIEGSWAGGPSRRDLEEMRGDEHQHHLLLKDAIEELGGNPTVVTPSASLHAVASRDLGEILADNRTNLREGLETILVAELEDSDCWTNLIDLARALDHQQLAERFTEALVHESEHLLKVRTWLGQALSLDSTGTVAQPFLDRSERYRARLQGSSNGTPARNRRSFRTGAKAKATGSEGKRSESSSRRQRARARK